MGEETPGWKPQGTLDPVWVPGQAGTVTRDPGGGRGEWQVVQGPGNPITAARGQDSGETQRPHTPGTRVPDSDPQLLSLFLDSRGRPKLGWQPVPPGGSSGAGTNAAHPRGAAPPSLVPEAPLTGLPPRQGGPAVPPSWALSSPLRSCPCQPWPRRLPRRWLSSEQTLASPGSRSALPPRAAGHREGSLASQDIQYPRRRRPGSPLPPLLARRPEPFLGPPSPAPPPCLFLPLSSLAGHGAEDTVSLCVSPKQPACLGSQWPWG